MLRATICEILLQHGVMGRLLSVEPIESALEISIGGAAMEYFAGLDISMKETHICVVERDGKVVYETKAATSPAAIAAELAKAPAAQRIVFETGRMATTLYHGLQSLGLAV